MRPLITYRSLAVFALVVSCMVGFSIWYLSNESLPRYSPVVHARKSVESRRQGTAPAPGVATPKVRPAPSITSVEPPLDPVLLMSVDGRKIDEVLRRYPGNSEQDHANTAQALINLLPSLAGEGRVECAQHIANLLSDKEYSRILPVWRNPASGHDVIEVLAADLMNRDHKVMLPAMLDAMKLPTHPFRDEAKASLQLFVNGDHGSDFDRWDAAVKNLLREEEQARQTAADSPRPGTLPPGVQR